MVGFGCWYIDCLCWCVMNAHMVGVGMVGVIIMTIDVVGVGMVWVLV